MAELTEGECLGGVEDELDVEETINTWIFESTIRDFKKFGVRCAQLARERAEKRVGEAAPKSENTFSSISLAKDAEITRLKEQLALAGEAPPAGNVTKDTSDWVCVTCQSLHRQVIEKDAEIVNLKETLAELQAIPIADGRRLDCSECKRLKEELANARSTIAEAYESTLRWRDRLHKSEADWREAQAKIASLKEAVALADTDWDNQLAEAQAKAIQPGDVVWRLDGEPMNPDGRLVLGGDGLIFYAGMGNTTHRQCYRRVQ